MQPGDSGALAVSPTAGGLVSERLPYATLVNEVAEVLIKRGHWTSDVQVVAARAILSRLRELGVPLPEEGT